MRTHQMVVILAPGPFRWRRGQIVPPLPKKESGVYYVQVTDRVKALRIAKNDLAPL